MQKDVVTVAKGLGGGLPIGGILVNEKCVDILETGTHGSIFGGNPIACAEANAVLDIILKKDFLESVRIKSNILTEGIKSLNKSIFGEVRGKGLMIGREIKEMEVKDLVSILLEKGLVTLSAGGATLYACLHL